MKTILTYLSCLAMVAVLSAQPGALDLSFGENGIVVTDFDLLEQYGREVLIQPDGKIIVAGFAQVEKTSCPMDFDFAMVRYYPDGSLDTSFGKNGLASQNYGIVGEGCPGNDFGFAAVLQPDGKIIVTGQSTQGTNQDWAVVRFLADGSPDENFGDLGVIFIPTQSNFATGEDIVRQSNGKYVLAGTVFNGSDKDFAVARLTPNLDIDLSFGENGIVTTDFGGSNEGAFSLVAQSNGKIVVAGYSESNIAVARYEMDGSLDQGFGNGGLVITDILGLEEQGFDLALQNDGKIVVGGFLSRPPTCVGFQCEREFAVIRYHPDGSLDESFGFYEPLLEQAGVVWVSVGPVTDRASTVALQPEGKILIAGQMGILSFGAPNSAFALARFNADGSLDESFSGTNYSLENTPGTVVTKITSNSTDAVFSLALQPDGKILAAGHAGADFAVSRYWSDLSSDIRTPSLPFINTRLYPNPLSTEAILEYELDKRVSLSIQLRDINGRLLKRFVDREEKGPGSQREILRFPESLPPGLFILAIRTEEVAFYIKVTHH